MGKIPFSVYDFFAYLASGSIVIAAVDYIYAIGLPNKDLGIVDGAILIVCAYVSGQIVAHFSSLTFEQWFIGRCLGKPFSTLLGQHSRTTAWRWLFPGYYKPLPTETQGRVRNKAAALKCPVEPDGLFLHAYSVITANEKFQFRLDEFRNQYGFARNMSFALIVSGLALLIARYYGDAHIPLRSVAFATFAGVSMFYRYLKFFRQYSFELLLRYAEFPLASNTVHKS